jgi:hypothetical protein
MRSKTLFHPPVTFFVIVISVLPAFSLTPEQCRVATESCISKCDLGSWTLTTTVLLPAVQNCPAPVWRTFAVVRHPTKVLQVPQRGRIRLSA